MATTDSSRPAATRWGPASPGRLTWIRCRDSKVTSSLRTESTKTSQASQPTIVTSPSRMLPSSRANSAARTDSQVSAGQRVAAQDGQRDGYADQAGGQQDQRAEPAQDPGALAGHDASGKKIVSIAATRKIRLKINAGRVM